MKYKIVLLFLIISGTSLAQETYQSIGIRIGGGGGITYKYVEDYRSGFEGILSYRDGGIQLTGLYEMYRPIKTDRINNFYFFSGFGAHAGYIRTYEQFCVQENGSCYMYSSQRTNAIVGLDGVVGFEYRFHSIPMGISLDYKPYVEFFGQDFLRIDLWAFDFSVKYAF